jgi:FkbM family methyltransferase
MRSLIGLMMRFYRGSPFHPRFGRTLALILGVFHRFRSEDVVLCEVGGIRFELDLTEVIDSSLYYEGTFERAAEQVMSRFIRPGMVVLDAGANIGYHTLGMARLVEPGGSVIAIEPTSRAFRRLQRNVGLNTFTTVKMLRLGLSDRDEGVIDAVFRSSFRLDGVDHPVSEPVELRSVDTLVESLGLHRLDFVKIDVDGLEAKVLRGAQRTLERFHPVLLFEVSSGSLETDRGTVAQPIHRLTGLGYSFRTEHDAAIEDLGRFVTALPSGCSANVLALPTFSPRD